MKIIALILLFSVLANAKDPIVINPEGATGSGGGGGYVDAVVKPMGYQVIDSLKDDTHLDYAGVSLEKLKATLETSKMVFIDTELFITVDGQKIQKDAAYDENADIIYISKTFNFPKETIFGLTQVEAQDFDFLKKVIVIHETIRRMHKLGFSQKNDSGFVTSLPLVREHQKIATPIWPNIENYTYTIEHKKLIRCQIQFILDKEENSAFMKTHSKSNGLYNTQGGCDGTDNNLVLKCRKNHCIGEMYNGYLDRTTRYEFLVLNDGKDLRLDLHESWRSGSIYRHHAFQFVSSPKSNSSEDSKNKEGSR